MAQVTETVARGILAGHGYTDNEVRQLAHHWLASHVQAPAGAVLPAGWVPLTITLEGQFSEEVAYGPQIMMDRLGKWLGKYFDTVVANKAQPAPATQQAVGMEVFGLQWPGEDRINLSTVFDTETEALEYMKNRCDTPGIRPVRFSSNAPTAQAAESVPAREHDLQDVRCECCGYMTYHREHMGCIHAARKQ